MAVFSEPRIVRPAGEVLIAFTGDFVVGASRTYQAPRAKRRGSCLLERHAHRDAHALVSLPDRSAIRLAVSYSLPEP
jgi:hypothetical protein